MRVRELLDVPDLRLRPRNDVTDEVARRLSGERAAEMTRVLDFFLALRIR